MADVVKAAKNVQEELAKTLVELEKYKKEIAAKKSKYVKAPSKHPKDMAKLQAEAVKTIRYWNKQIDDMEKQMKAATSKVADLNARNGRYQRLVDKMVPGIKKALQEEMEELVRRLEEALGSF